MDISVKQIEKITISYAPSEYQEALDYCNAGGYEIVSNSPNRDGRSGKYLQGSKLQAERIKGRFNA